jgi:hypothetical protein
MRQLIFFQPLVIILLLVSCLAIAQTPLSGNYTINAGSPASATNFQSFNALADSLNQNGVSADVTVTVTSGSGPYMEQVIFNNIQGTAANATITIEGSGETITAITNTTDRHVIRLANIQYFTINNLKILRDVAGAAGFYGIHIFQSGNHITLSNNEVDLAGSTSTLAGAYIASGSETSILAAGDFHNINIILNKSNTGGYGASVYGEPGNLSTNIKISGNEFISFNDNGVYLRETDSTIISGNYFDKLTTNVSGWNAIQVAQALNINTQIFNNEIKVSQISNGTSTIRGIYLFNGTGHRVYNNVIHDVALTSGNFTGIEIRTSGTVPEIYFNTINLNNATASSGNLYGIKEELSNTNSILRNNLINITQSTTGNKSALVLGSNATVTSAFNSDYNWLWIPGGNIAQRGTLTPTFYPSMIDWQSASGQDNNSLNIDPQLMAIIYPIPTNLNGDDAGIVIPFVSNDFLGVTRGSPPDIGAFEFGGCPPNAPVEVFGDSLICVNATNIVYSINPVSGATGYTWTVPPGANITSGQNSTSIVVDFGTQSGAITVTADDSCGSSPASTLVINIQSALSAPAAISGPASLCEKETLVIYSADTVSGSNSYNWTVPAGSTIISGQGSSSIAVNFGSTSGNITVEAVNSCGSSPPATFPVTLNPLPNVSFTLPSDTLCDNDVITLSGGSPANGIYSGPGIAPGSGIFDAMVAGTGLHTLTYTFQDTNSCIDSATANIFVEVCIGINDFNYENSVSVYPNPANDYSIIEIDGDLKPFRIIIFDETGKKIMTIEQPDRKTRIEKSDLKAGIYFIEVDAGDHIIIRKKLLVF